MLTVLISHLTDIWIVNFKLKRFTALCDAGAGRLQTVLLYLVGSLLNCANRRR